MIFLKKKKPIISTETLVVLTVATLITFVAVVADRLNAGPSTNTRAHQISEIVEVKNLYSVVVTQAAFDNTIGPKLHLPDTLKTLVINVQITNLSKDKLNYLPIIHTFLRNDRGESYKFTPGLTDNTMPAELIEPGQTLKGDLAFVVPAKYMPFWFYFDAKFDGQGPIAYRIVQ